MPVHRYGRYIPSGSNARSGRAFRFEWRRGAGQYRLRKSVQCGASIELVDPSECDDGGIEVSRGGLSDRDKLRC